jgi:hypothetical protein
MLKEKTAKSAIKYVLGRMSNFLYRILPKNSNMSAEQLPNGKYKIVFKGRQEGYWRIKGSNYLWWLHPSFPLSFKIVDEDVLYDDEIFENDHMGVVNVWGPRILEEFAKLPIKVKSILELGAGGGWFTKYFADNNYSVYAVEGTLSGYKTALNSNKIPKGKILKHDLRIPLVLNQKYDIAICTEVAEHLEIPFAATIVKSCCDYSDFVFFSAPYGLERPQSIHHPTEQPKEFWDALFAFNGFEIYKRLNWVDRGDTIYRRRK